MALYFTFIVTLWADSHSETWFSGITSSGWRRKKLEKSTNAYVVLSSSVSSQSVLYDTIWVFFFFKHMLCKMAKYSEREMIFLLLLLLWLYHTTTIATAVFVVVTATVFSSNYCAVSTTVPVRNLFLLFHPPFPPFSLLESRIYFMRGGICVSLLLKNTSLLGHIHV